MMMCGEARRLAWPDGAPRAVNEKVAAAEAHVAECAACQAFMSDMRSLAHSVAASAPNDSAPREVRERLFAALARARFEDQRAQARRLTTRRLAAAGIVAAIVLGTAVWRLSPPRAADVAARLADDHRQALHTDGIASGDTAAAARWLSDRVGFAVHVPTFTNGQLLRARVADMEGRRSAVLAYRIDGQDVSYYILPAGRNGIASVVPGAPAVRVSAWSGFRIASWREPGLTHALVGNLPAARLAGLARECIRQMLAFVEFPSLWS